VLTGLRIDEYFAASAQIAVPMVLSVVVFNDSDRQTNYLDDDVAEDGANLKQAGRVTLVRPSEMCHRLLKKS
jgi:hypothetical protein